MDRLADALVLLLYGLLSRRRASGAMPLGGVTESAGLKTLAATSRFHLSEP